MLKVGDKVKITKGTHKNKWGYIYILKDSFIQVKTQHYVKSKAQGDAEDVCVEKVVRAKREFVVPVPGVVIEMPDAEQVHPVGEFEEEAVDIGMSDADQKLCQQILDQMPLPPNDDDILSQHDEEEVDISGGVIGQAEAEADASPKRIKELEDLLVKQGYELAHLRESAEMFKKCYDFVTKK
jgi:ribosomal protein L24